MAKDEDLLLPKKKKPALVPSGGQKVSAPMLRIMRLTRAAGLLLGGLVTTVALMGVVGLVTDNFLARLLVALLFVVGLPALTADRLLKRTKLGGGLPMVIDVFAIVLLALAMVFVAADALSKPLFVREGDRYAESGTRSMARVAYWLGGVAPVFPEERGLSPTAGPGASGSVAASASGSAAAPPKK